MEKSDIELKLLAGLPIPVHGAGNLYIPSFRQIADLGLSFYNQSLSYLLINKSMFEKKIDDEISNFDVFYANCYHDHEFRSIAFIVLGVLFKTNIIILENNDEAYLRIDKNHKIDHSNFDEIQEIIKIANHINLENEPEFKPGNSKAQEMISMILKNRNKQPKPKEKMDLVSILSGLAWKQNGVNIFNVFDLNIYQIYNGFQITNNIDNYHHTLTGLYAGTVDGKKIKMSDLHWANKTYL